MRLLAPAKLNLHLRVGPPRADGFHPLLSWMVTIGFFDTLIIEPSPQPGIRLECDWPEVPCDARNLVSKAAAALAEALIAAGQGSAKQYGLSVRLHKQIPVGAGLAGGSSDGARILAGLNVLWNAGWDRQRLADFAARFGSDLSFFFFAPSAICTGRGEIVRPIASPQAKFALLILPEITMPTPLVYRRFDGMKLGDAATIETEPDFNGWARLDALSLLPRLVNDLEAPAFAIDPRLGDLRRNVEQTVGRRILMSGSGSSLFTLFDEEPQAAAAEHIVVQRHRVRAIVARLAPLLQDDLNTSGAIR